MSNIVIQRVDCTWTKKSRGGEAARVRNAIPVVVPVPDAAFDSPFFLHHATFSEYRGFQLSERVLSGDRLPNRKLHGIEFIMNEDNLLIRFHRDPYNAATPRAKPRTVDVFSIGESQWGQLTYNGRYVDFDSGKWWYEKTVFNIARTPPNNPKLFLKTVPDYKFSEMAYLR